jgi:hypothetical protein
VPALRRQGPRFGVSALEETFESAFAEVTEGKARYSAFRRFAVDTLEKRGGG